MNWYLAMWRDAFTGDWYERLLSRLAILCLHTGLIIAALMIVVAFR